MPECQIILHLAAANDGGGAGDNCNSKTYNAPFKSPQKYSISTLIFSQSRPPCRPPTASKHWRHAAAKNYRGHRRRTAIPSDGSTFQTRSCQASGRCTILHTQPIKQIWFNPVEHEVGECIDRLWVNTFIYILTFSSSVSLSVLTAIFQVNLG